MKLLWMHEESLGFLRSHFEKVDEAEFSHNEHAQKVWRRKLFFMRMLSA